MLQRLSCGKHFYATVFQKRTTTLFLSLDWVIMSSFSISQNHVNSVFFRGHWGKQLAEKTSLNPILPRYESIYLHEILADTQFIYKVLCS